MSDLTCVCLPPCLATRRHTELCAGQTGVQPGQGSPAQTACTYTQQLVDRQSVAAWGLSGLSLACYRYKCTCLHNCLRCYLLNCTQRTPHWELCHWRYQSWGREASLQHCSPHPGPPGSLPLLERSIIFIHFQIDLNPFYTFLVNYSMFGHHSIRPLLT